jgi:hypothetical protein
MMVWMKLDSVLFDLVWNDSKGNFMRLSRELPGDV